MNIGLKTRLILAFISIIILPVLVTIGLLYVYLSNIDERFQGQEDKMDQLFQDISDEVKENEQMMDQTDLFFQEIQPVLEKYDIHLAIQSPDNEVLFDSRDFQPDESSGFFSQMDSLRVDVELSSGQRVHVEIMANSFQAEPFHTLYQVLKDIFISLSIGLLTLIVLIVGWTWYISRTILYPLKQIYTATEEMKEGNLSYPIQYNKKDEIGHFVHGFNLMRKHLKQSIEKQKQYEKSRKELIASISHDLRTPLSSIKGYVEGLMDGVARTEEMQKKYLRVIKDKTDQLDHLIEDLFEFSKLELNQLPVERVYVNSQEFFNEVLRGIEMDVEQKGVQLNVEDPVPSVCIHIDPQRIQQVLLNLMYNSVRYGASTISIHISENRVKGHLQVQLTDDGNGISKEDLPYIFNRFYRGEKSRSREHGGSGLGLAIVKSIIQTHDGEIRAESEEGQGSRFTFTLPLCLSRDNDT
ncbi:HAMP domain-containing protein [Melghiribacillus thermohalophilus]|uniref:histidine kinase n=1 Tax=Melghiribacillus thermohalophilus TaxID=1324956 RepID=A0A4R3MVG5_9BACI|nr:HAMP domain-containing sensor histidine kinase [Melghiribacillus thermohalophilus]TCT17534.1 HAMP domain-containing protein [Melghiribacillus thermohalophilus]